jgi:MoxR-like ATPase
MTEAQGAGAQAAEPSRVPRSWWVYRGTGLPGHDISLDDVLPPPPPWRTFDGASADPARSGADPAERTEPAPPPEDAAELLRRLGTSISAVGRDVGEADMVNAALLLRRPLLVTGRPGTGKSTLAYRISRELGLGRVLRWPISSHSTLASGLYTYDAVGRVHAAATASADRGAGQDAGRGADEAAGPAAEAAPDAVSGIGDFLQLGPLGTALLPYRHPRVLLVDEFDKSDMDFPNDLLDIFESGEFTVPELARLRRHQPRVRVQTDDPGGSAWIEGGRVRCRAFPVVIVTSNGERDFPPAFLRRCLHLQMAEPDLERLTDIVTAHLGPLAEEPRLRELIAGFAERSRREKGLAADQLLNALYLASSGAQTSGAEWEALLHAVWHRLDGPGSA